MYVPDPGLMAKIDNLLKNSGQFYLDARVRQFKLHSKWKTRNPDDGYPSGLQFCGHFWYMPILVYSLVCEHANV